MEHRRTGEKRKWGEQSSSRNSPDRLQDRGMGQRNRGPRDRHWADDQVKINQVQENERMREWVAQEDDFVLRQAKRKAEIRVHEGRANPIDWLAVTLRPIDPTRNELDDEVDENSLEFVSPESVFDGLSETQLDDLRKDIDTYLKLEKNAQNREYWRTMQVICKDQRGRLRLGPEGRAVSSVSTDIDRLLGSKTFDQLTTLEVQIQKKFDSNEPIDTDYWQQLLDSLLVWKAKARVKKLYQSVIGSRLKSLRIESEREALEAAKTHRTDVGQLARVSYSKSLDPDALLQIQPTDKSLVSISENDFLRRLLSDRRRIQEMGYVPAPNGTKAPSSGTLLAQGPIAPLRDLDRAATTDESQLTKSLYDREVARGVDEDEEVFAGEEEVETKSKPAWEGSYRPRKPKYFNRVQMGYEWNKYNQTHYDHDNPPPKVVQGYKFHIFYPDLVDRTKAPSFRIVREGGRKKGQSIAPAGEEDTCIIRFTAGPPYEDLAFRIVDRDWDYSAKYDRGFKSTFEKGILTLHFSFKKIFYRK